MTATTPSFNLGRHVYGTAALASGLVMLVWHDYRQYDQLNAILNATDGSVAVYSAAVAQIFGGLTIQIRQTEKAGAMVLGLVYLVLALLYVPQIIAAPQTYDPWGNLFEHCSLVLGAAIVYVRSSRAWPVSTVRRAGCIVLGVCSASFGAEQAIHLAFTASLVPKWLPPGQIFWAVTTTVAFAIAAIALVTNRTALLATRLLTLIIATFGLVVWVPLVLSDPHNHTNWSEATETFTIAGALWILAELLERR